MPLPIKKKRDLRRARPPVFRVRAAKAAAAALRECEDEIARRKRTPPSSIIEKEQRQ